MLESWESSALFCLFWLYVHTYSASLTNVRYSARKLVLRGLADFFLAIWVEKWAASNDVDPNNKLGYWLGIYYLLAALAVTSIVASCW